MGRAVVIAVVNHKGGCGKTTTVTNLGAALAAGSPEMGIMANKVLIVDLDPRGNVATTFGVEKRSLGPTMNNLFEAVIDGSRIDPNPYILAPHELTKCMRRAWKRQNPDRPRGPPKGHFVDRLSLLPADLDLSGIEIELAMRIGREHRLKIALEGAMDDYDLIIIDTPASLGLLTINALTAADWLLIPIQAEFYALESMGQLLDTLNKVQTAVNPKLRLLGITMTMVQGGSNLGRTVADAAKRHFGGRILETHIPRSVAVAEAPLEGAPVALSKSAIERHPGSLAYWNLAKEVSSRLEIIRTQRSV
jgi:chromosome partitioning protein